MTERMNAEDVIKKAKVFLEYKTFTYILEIDSSGNKRFYNGYILSIHEDLIVMQDRKISNPIPIPIDFIVKIEASEVTF